MSRAYSAQNIVYAACIPEDASVTKQAGQSNYAGKQQERMRAEVDRDTAGQQSRCSLDHPVRSVGATTIA